MNILHYSLGVYPDRQGGLVRYSTDLAKEQSRSNKVYYIMPGKLGIINKKVKIVGENKNSRINYFKVENAHPIPLFAGIKDVELYIKSANQEIYDSFLEKNDIDILHIHTLMGLHIELLRAARKKNIPIIMTTHDFFGICPITTMFRDGDVCKYEKIGEHCYSCSNRAYGYLKLAVGQSKMYKYLKKSKIGMHFRKNALTDCVHDNNMSECKYVPDYKKLNDYYRECFSLVTCFLFNSQQTKEVMERRLGDLNGKVIPLLLPSIKDNRKKRQFMKDGILHIGYLGECKSFKGYFLLEQVVIQLSEHFPIELDVYNDDVEESGAIVKKGKYSAEELYDIYDGLDVIVVPSIWYETLSFIAIEAISAGMPCIISTNVGAKDLVENLKNAFIVEAGNGDSLKKCLKKIIDDPCILSVINENIINTELNLDFKEHCDIVYSNYKM